GNPWPSMAIFPGRTSRRTHGGHGTGPFPATTQLTGEPTFPECTSVPGLAGEATQACGLARTALTTQLTVPPGVSAATTRPARPADTMLSGSRAAPTSGFPNAAARPVSNSAT